MNHKIFIFFLFAFLSIGVKAEVITGVCGSNLTYELDLSTGVLKIEGSGTMENYSSKSLAPWHEYSALITDLSLSGSISNISDYAFYECYGLLNVVLPNSITSIGQYSFYGCTNLNSATIPKSVSDIGDLAFSHCNSLASVTIPNSVTSIKRMTFSYCQSLTSMHIPNSVTSIGDNAFDCCRNLSSVTIPNSVTSIGNSAFFNCNLSEISIPKSVKSIGGSAFGNCRIKTVYWDASFNYDFNLYSIENVFIGDNVSIVYPWFAKCSNTRKVVLGKSVNLITTGAFKDTKIKELYVTSEDVPDCQANVFQNVALSEATLYVPSKKASYYITKEPWSSFGKILDLEGNEPEIPALIQCASPSISYENGILYFTSTTPLAQVKHTISVADAITATSGEQKLSATYNITAIAMRDGYLDSDVSEATLCWINANFETESIVNTFCQNRAILISSNDGKVSISGLEDGEMVMMYGIDGRFIDSSNSFNGLINFFVQPGKVVVLKIGEHNFKVIVR